MPAPANQRPLAVTIIALLFATAGAAGLAYHLTEYKPAQLLQMDAVWVLLVRLAAVAAGAFMLRGRNWSRWLAVLWMAFHVVLSAFHSWSELAMHGLLLGVFAFFLFRPPASDYFRAARAGPTVPEGGRR